MTANAGPDPAYDPALDPALETARERARAALRRHSPELADLPLEALGSGLDHIAFQAGDLVLRISDDQHNLAEARLLRLVGPRLSVAIPVPVFGDDAEGVLAYQKLPGRSLLGHPPLPGSAAVLGRFLGELHCLPTGEFSTLVTMDSADPDEWLDDLDGPAELIAVVRSGVPEPGSALDCVLVHGDLGAEHLLHDGSQLTGVIDWADSVVSDPELDFARLYRDFGPAFLDDVLAAYRRHPGTGPIDLDRVEFFARCAALEDLAYGIRTGRREYQDAAERSLTWLFPDA